MQVPENWPGGDNELTANACRRRIEGLLKGGPVGSTRLAAA